MSTDIQLDKMNIDKFQIILGKSYFSDIKMPSDG